MGYREFEISRAVLAGGLCTLLAATALFVFSGRPESLLLPFVYLYLLLLTYDWKAGYWLLLFVLLFSVHLDLADGTLSTTVPDEPMVWVYFLLFFLFLAHRPGSLPGWFLFHPLTVIIALQFICLLIAVAFSEVFIPSLKFLVAKSWYLVVFYGFPTWVFKNKKDISTAFWVLLVPLCITIAIVTARHAAFEFSFLSVNKAIGKMYYNHVEYGAVISMFIPFLIVSFFITNKNKPGLRLLAFMITMAFAVVLFFTYARAAMLAVAFAAVVAFCIRLRLVNFIMPALYLAIAAMVFFLAQDNRYMAYTPNYERTYMRKNLSDHIEATFQGQDMSSMERVYRWIAAVRMSDERPLTGFGPHSFTARYKAYTVSAFRTYVSDNPEQSTTHNYFLLMLTEQGWPAMLLYALLTPAAFWQAQKTYHRFKDRFYKLATLGLAMMLAACFVNNFFSELIETHKLGAMFYVGLSLLVWLSHKSKQPAGETGY